MDSEPLTHAIIQETYQEEAKNASSPAQYDGATAERIQMLDARVEELRAEVEASNKELEQMRAKSLDSAGGLSASEARKMEEEFEMRGKEAVKGEQEGFSSWPGGELNLLALSACGGETESSRARAGVYAPWSRGRQSLPARRKGRVRPVKAALSRDDKQPSQSGPRHPEYDARCAHERE